MVHLGRLVASSGVYHDNLKGFGMTASTQAPLFGSDMGLIFKVVVAGRKHFADKRFWAALADYEELFGNLVGLVEQIEVVMSNLGHPATAYPIKNEDVKPIQDFFRILDEILSWKYPAEVYIFDPPAGSEFFSADPKQRENWDRLDNYLREDGDTRLLSSCFMQKICVLVRDMGLDPAELVRYLVPADKEGNFKMWRDVPFNREVFIANLKLAIKRRKVMATLYARD